MAGDDDAKVAREKTPGGSVRKPSAGAPENFGQEGSRSPIKPNTTVAGEKQDRGP